MTTKPTFREQLTDTLPTHTSWTTVLSDQTATWTTPAGIWRITRHLFAGLHVTGPGLNLAHTTIDHALGVLRALGAIPSTDDPVTEAEYAEIHADLDTTLQLLPAVDMHPDARRLLEKYGHRTAEPTPCAPPAPATPCTRVNSRTPRPIGPVSAEAQQHIDAVTTEPTDWLVWSLQHQAWWSSNGAGYTTDHYQAARLTKAQATDEDDWDTTSSVAIQIPGDLMVGDPLIADVLAQRVAAEVQRRTTEATR
ncbi:hypothetical protein ACFQZ4_24065 [Catellatospora coxensis]